MAVNYRQSGTLKEPKICLMGLSAPDTNINVSKVFDCEIQPNRFKCLGDCIEVVNLLCSVGEVHWKVRRLRMRRMRELAIEPDVAAEPRLFRKRTAAYMF
jgi:hypothetical protein